MPQSGSRPRSSRRLCKKSGEAILPTRDGATNGRERRQYPASLYGVWHQPELLPLPGKAVSRECRNRRPPDPTDPQPAELGIRAVLSVPAQREGRPMESQTGVSHLPRARTGPADQGLGKVPALMRSKISVRLRPVRAFTCFRRMIVGTG